MISAVKRTNGVNRRINTVSRRNNVVNSKNSVVRRIKDANRMTNVVRKIKDVNKMISAARKTNVASKLISSRTNSVSPVSEMSIVRMAMAWTDREIAMGNVANDPIINGRDFLSTIADVDLERNAK